MAYSGSYSGGVNLSSGNVGAYPGKLGTNYHYGTTQDIDYFVAKGLTNFRVAFSVGHLVGSESQIDISNIKMLTDYAARKGATIILDMHDFGYNQDGTLIGSSASSTTTFSSNWSQIASQFKGYSNIIFALNNEPHVQTVAQWFGAANAAIDAIRSTGATQQILVPGTSWDGAWTWISSGNAAAFQNTVKDPLNNYVVDVHQYLDTGSTGTSTYVVPGSGATRLVEATKWARENGQHLFLSEFGFGQDAASLKEGADLVKYMKSNSDVWQGSTYWAAGDWWDDYFFSVQPTGLGTANVTDKPQLSSLTAVVSPAPSITAPGNTDKSEVHAPKLEQQAVFRFFDTKTGDHFYTTSAAEKAQIQATIPSFNYEGSPWSAPVEGADTHDVFRFQNTKTGTHFFTDSLNERDSIIANIPTYKYEGVAFSAYNDVIGSDRLTLERFYNTNTGEHHYAGSKDETDSINQGHQGQGWIDEGRTFTVHEPIGAPLYA